MKSSLTVLKLAVILSATLSTSLLMSHATAAPQCRQVLKSFTQEQIDSAITEFASLTLYTNQLQVLGTMDAKYASARSAQNAKEKELINILGISRAKLIHLVRQKNLKAQKQIAQEGRKEKEAREEQTKTYVPVLNKFIPMEIDPSRVLISKNGSRLAIPGFGKFEIVNLASGKTKVYDNNKDVVHFQLSNNIFSSNYKSRDQIVITNLNDGSQRRVSLEINNRTGMYSAARDAVVYYEFAFGGDFKYLVMNSNGDVVVNNSTSVKQIVNPAIVNFIGDNVILKSGTNETHYRLNLKTKEVVILPIGKYENITVIPDSNKVLVQNNSRTVFDIVDIDYLIRTKHQFSNTVDIAYIDKNIAWFEIQSMAWNKSPNEEGNLIKVNLSNPSVIREQVFVGRWNDLLVDIPGTPWVSMSTGTGAENSIQAGIYRKGDLAAIVNMGELYAEKLPHRQVLNMWVSDGAKTIVVYSKDISDDPATAGLEVWRLK
jgi:hypothetical protein